MNIEQEKMIVESLSSLYPLQEFEEKAIDTVLNAIPHWIPCSERLPSKEGEYLITNDAGGVKNIEVDTLLHYEDGEPFWFYSQNPIAWRELPVPFGEE